MASGAPEHNSPRTFFDSVQVVLGGLLLPSGLSGWSAFENQLAGEQVEQVEQVKGMANASGSW